MSIADKEKKDVIYFLFNGQSILLYTYLYNKLSLLYQLPHRVRGKVLYKSIHTSDQSTAFFPGQKLLQ